MESFISVIWSLSGVFFPSRFLPSVRVSHSISIRDVIDVEICTKPRSAKKRIESTQTFSLHTGNSFNSHNSEPFCFVTTDVATIVQSVYQTYSTQCKSLVGENQQF